MAGFNFEKNLIHQSQAVQAVVRVFDGVEIHREQGVEHHHANPQFNRKVGLAYGDNILALQKDNNIQCNAKRYSNIIDIAMETGTGKTYTYVQTMFELNKHYGIFKFVIVVPTLPIKAGTIDFLRSESARGHFREQYGKTIALHNVESVSARKNKKALLPPAISSFVNAGNYERNVIQVLVINAGMINSKTLHQAYDRSLLDDYTVPTAAIAATKAFMIVDEPHKFATENKTWENLQHMKPQFILRYGATFKENQRENLVYKLSAVDAFNQNLVKGVIGHITQFNNGANVLVRFVSSDGKEANFELVESNRKTVYKVARKESLEKVHPAMSDLLIEKLNKSTAVLSNGLELKKGDKINPFSYAKKLQEVMIEKAIQHHFEQEKKYLTRDIKIKPLTLFFIDNIEEYRQQNGYVRKTVEACIVAHVKALLAIETDAFYIDYLNKTLEDVSKTHGGYFAIDKKETDEVIEQEITEILHDKQAILDLNNPRRFVFSKWTLREGWDNPNIFQICKLRSSGSEISKLQEVGRGLRLPVNEYGNRVKDEPFFLNYFVDFTESDFVDALVNEINEKSGAISREEVPEKLHEQMIQQIVEKYSISEEELLDKLDAENVIKRNNAFKEGGFDYIKAHYPLIFEGVNSVKVRKSTDTRKKVAIRSDSYQRLKVLWEKINEKVVMEYKIGHETEFGVLFRDFLTQGSWFVSEGLQETTSTVGIQGDRAVVQEETVVYGNNMVTVSTMTYDDFLMQLSRAVFITIKTLHQCFVDANVMINRYLNQSTIRTLKQKFNNYLMYKAFSKFSVAYQHIDSAIHPTKLTDATGKVYNELDASDVGVFYSDDTVADNYLLDALFYDSELEKENITQQIREVVVFTKIPRNSIKIPVAGGKSYSPDFAYVINYSNGAKKLHFIVETKNADHEVLRDEEKQKILHAEAFFSGEITIRFKTQLKNQTIEQLIQEIIKD
jgi:type III restriction enzyme